MGTIVVAGIAGVLFTGGPASLSSVLAAALVMQWLEQAMAILGLPAGARVAIQGVVLVLAVAALTIGGFGAAATACLGSSQVVAQRATHQLTSRRTHDVRPVRDRATSRTIHEKPQLEE